MEKKKTIIKEKIGLNIQTDVADKLTELSVMTGLTKSKIVEKAISMFDKSVIEARRRAMINMNEDDFLDISLILSDRIQKEQEIMSEDKKHKKQSNIQVS